MSIDFSDQDLLVRVRSGDSSAFGDLYAHYSPAAHRAARRIVRDPHAAEDLVSESFARVFSALRGEHGPRGDLYPYLLVTMRNIAASWGRDTVRWTPVGDDAAFQPRDARDHVSGADEAPVDQLNASLTSTAFETLPPRWRTVLWYLEVEGESASEVGARLGLTDVAIRQLARRAREGLREAYLTAYLGGTNTVGAHIPIVDLVQMARGKISLRRRAHVEAHLDTCPDCTRMLFEAAEENSTLRALALPFYLAAALAVVGFFHRLPLPNWAHRSRRPVQQGVFAGFAIAAMALTAVAGAVTVGHTGSRGRTGDTALRAGVTGSKSGKAGQSGSSGSSGPVGGVTLPSTVGQPNGNGTGNGVTTSTAPGASTTTASNTATPTTTTGPTSAPTATTNPTSGPTSAPTSTVRPTPGPTGVVLPTLPRTPIPTVKPTIIPTATPNPSPTVTVTPTPTPTPTASPTTATTDPTTTAPTTTAPTTTTATPTTDGQVDLAVASGPTYDSSTGATTFTITITNNTAQAWGIDLTFVVPAGYTLGPPGVTYSNCQVSTDGSGLAVCHMNQPLTADGDGLSPLAAGTVGAPHHIELTSTGSPKSELPAFPAITITPVTPPQ